MTKSRTRSPRHLSDTALILLGRAADREARMLLPIPKTVKAHGKALERVLQSLLNQGFVEEIPVGLAEEAWRSDHDGRYGLRITEVGLRAVGVPALESGLEGGPGDDQPAADVSVATHERKPPRPGTKQARLIELLSEPSGRTVDELATTLGWLPHTTRAAITGLRKSGHAVVGAKNEAGKSVYRIEGDGVGSMEAAAFDHDS